LSEQPQNLLLILRPLSDAFHLDAVHLGAVRALPLGILQSLLRFPRPSGAFCIVLHELGLPLHSRSRLALLTPLQIRDAPAYHSDSSQGEDNQ
jgi:hypothetical protein